MRAGPAPALRGLLEQLKADSVFVRELDTLGIAYHSPALEPLLPELKQGTYYRCVPPGSLRRKVSMIKLVTIFCVFAAISKAVPEPKERASTWISTCFPIDSEDPNARLCSAQYQVSK